MGGDKESARNAGIPVNRMTILLFILTATSGLCGHVPRDAVQLGAGLGRDE